MKDSKQKKNMTIISIVTLLCFVFILCGLLLFLTLNDNIVTVAATSETYEDEDDDDEGWSELTPEEYKYMCETSPDIYCFDDMREKYTDEEIAQMFEDGGYVLTVLFSPDGVIPVYLFANTNEYLRIPHIDAFTDEIYDSLPSWCEALCYEEDEDGLPLVYTYHKLPDIGEAEITNIIDTMNTANTITFTYGVVADIDGDEYATLNNCDSDEYLNPDIDATFYYKAKDKAIYDLKCENITDELNIHGDINGLNAINGLIRHTFGIKTDLINHGLFTKLNQLRRSIDYDYEFSIDETITPDIYRKILKTAHVSDEDIDRIDFDSVESCYTMKFNKFDQDNGAELWFITLRWWCQTHDGKPVSFRLAYNISYE